MSTYTTAPILDGDDDATTPIPRPEAALDEAADASTPAPAKKPATPKKSASYDAAAITVLEGLDPV
ncbi:MAG: hypothetical protein AAGG08_13150, partial [Actinomycetota bacterium]